MTGSSEIRTEHMALTRGADLGLLNLGGGGWNVHVGVLGGWYNGRANLSSAEQLKVETPFLGGYVAVGNGAFQLDGTLRGEWRHYTVVLPVLFGPGAPQKLDGSATAGSVHASYRFGGKTGFAATPFLGFNYADSSIDSLQIDALSAYIPGGDKTEMGEGGLRVSYRGGSDAKVVVEPFASASYLKNWSRGDSAVFSFGTPVTNFGLATTTWDNAIRYSVGVTAKAKDGRVTGFLVGNINDGTGLHSFSLNAGVRFNF
jgi:outer membrane autotransporter protein